VAADRPPLRAELADCQTGAAPAERFAVFTGSMPALKGTAWMSMRFDLYQRRPGARGFARIALPHWGTWERTTQAGVPGFVFTKRVEQLAAPARYRALVRFRWYGADGRLQRRAARLSPVCAQPDPRPDLRVGTVSASADGHYLVVVRNAGRGAAGPFALDVAVDGVVASTTVSGLAPGTSQTVAVGGNRCRPGGQVRVVVDPAHAVDEADERNDAVSRPCPFDRR
jgi:hypothetical protein